MEGLLLVPATSGYRRIGTYSQPPLRSSEIFSEIRTAQEDEALKRMQSFSTVDWSKILGDCNRFVKDDNSFEFQVNMFELSII